MDHYGAALEKLCSVWQIGCFKSSEYKVPMQEKLLEVFRVASSGVR